jgi:tetratricopeptide (TPR) repeat protein
MLLECASVRLTVILFLLAAVLPSQADTIILKNGKRIVVDTAREKNGRVEYEIGGNTYALPMTLVDRIEKSGDGPQPTALKTYIPFTPTETIPSPKGLNAKIIHDGKVDADALGVIDRWSDDQTAGAGYFQAARFEQDHGNRDTAITYYERALLRLPENSAILEHYASMLIQMGRGDEAVPLAGRATKVAPNSADSWTILGYACFSADQNTDAINAWKRALELRKDATVEGYLAKAQREETEEAEYEKRQSAHFTLRYEGHRVAESMSKAVLKKLEEHYESLSELFGTRPTANIAVTLYTDEAFFDVTQSPSWTGAINDGKIRVPISGLTEVTPELSRILRHELVHSFINQISRGRCPQWLQEGIAQLLEPRSAKPYGKTLAKLYADQHQIPMNLLEGSFLNLKTEDASVAYLQSLAVTEYISDTFGMAYIRLILERIGEGMSTEAALRSVIHSGYDRLEVEVADYLKARYGV